MLLDGNPADVPSPIDLKDPIQARAWMVDAVARRPWRPRFFAAFVDALSSHFDQPIRVAELGSGPGHLAKAILDACPDVGEYIAVDFSPAMHALAQEHLGANAGSLRYEVRDFRNSDWAAGIAPIDAIVTMQAAHELRHKTRLPKLLAEMHGALRTGGLLLFCDHYAEAGTAKHPELFPEHAQQRVLLEAAGFVDVEEILDEGGMALYRCRKG